MLERLRLRLNISWSKALAGIALVSTVAYAAQNFNSINVNGNITVTGNVDGRDVSADGSVIDAITANGVTALTSSEVDQLENINATTISSTTWGHLGGIDQALSSTSSPTFNSVTGTLSTAAQPNITSLGTLTALSVDAPLNLLQQTTPANPAASRNKLYFKSDDKLYRLTSAGVETEVGSGGTSFDDSIFEIYDDGDNTKLINFEAAGITPGQTRTITMADANIDLAEISDATASNNAGTIVKRDGSGDFSAGTITANLTGNASGTAANVTGLVAIANGGTNNSSLGVTAGGVVYTDGSKLMNTGAGTAGYVITSNGASAPTWSALPAGGTNDQREYVTNGKFETDVSGWTTYDDASAVPVDCNGGTVSATFTRTTTVGEVIRETASGELTKDAADRQGEGVAIPFTLDPNDYTTLKGIPISFEYNNTAALASGDILIYVYDVDAASTPQAVQTLQSSTAGTVPSSSSMTRWNGIFYPTDAASDSYRLCVHIATTNASAYDLHLDSVHIGNQNVTPGFLGSDLGTETWTDDQTNATTSVKITRNGEWFIGDFVTTYTGTVTGSSLNVTIPAAYTAASNYSFTSGAAVDIGRGLMYDVSSGGTFYTANVRLASASLVRVVTENTTVTYLVPNQFSTTTPFTWASGDTIQYRGMWRVAGWSASAALSTTETLFSTATVGVSGDPASAAVGNPIIFPTETYDVFSAYDNTTGRFTAPKSGKYRVFGALGSASSATTLSVYVNAVSRALAGNLDSNGEATFAATVSVSKGDLIDLRPGGTVDAATSSFFIEELPDFSIFSVYGISDYISATGAVTNLPTTTQYGDLASISLPPGEWDIGVNAIFHRNTTSEAAFTACNIGVSTTSGNSTSGLTLGVNWMQASQTFGFGSNFPMTLGGYRVTPTTTTTYYLKFAGTYSANQPQAEGTIYARKVK